MQIAQHRCEVVEFPFVGNQTSSGILDLLQFCQYTVAYTGQKTVAVIQAAANESMYERLNRVWRQRTSHMAELPQVKGSRAENLCNMVRHIQLRVDDEAKIRHCRRKADNGRRIKG